MSKDQYSDQIEDYDIHRIANAFSREVSWLKEHGDKMPASQLQQINKENRQLLEKLARIHSQQTLIRVLRLDNDGTRYHAAGGQSVRFETSQGHLMLTTITLTRRIGTTSTGQIGFAKVKIYETWNWKSREKRAWI